MRYYHPVSQHVREFPNARLRFFLLGPLYLLWQRLWIDAVVCALLIWGVIHSIVIVTDAVTPVSTRPSLNGVLDAYAAVQNAANLGVPADLAMRELVAAMLPFYVSGFALVLLMSLLTFYLPTYLDWRLRKRGYRRLLADEEDV